MLAFVVFTLSVAVTIIIGYGITMFLNTFREWDLDIEFRVLIVGIVGLTALIAGAVLMDSRVALIWLFPGIVGITMFLFIMTLLMCFAASALGRWAVSVGARANQARADRDFHRNLERE